MASGTLGAGEPRERSRWGENSKVYTRKIHNKGLKKNNVNVDVTTVTDPVNANNAREDGQNITNIANTAAPSSPNVDQRRDNNNDKNNCDAGPQQSTQTVANEEANSSQRQQTLSRVEGVSDDSSSQNRTPHDTALNGCEPPSGNGALKPIITKVDGKVRINLGGARHKNEIRELKRKLTSELDQVRSLAKKLETKEVQLTSYSAPGGYSQPQHLGNNGRCLVRVNSEVGSVDYHEPRPFLPPTVLVTESNRGVGEFAEKEKRTPKANQYYQNSEFILGKEKLPPAESNRKLKSSGGRKHGGDMGYGFGVDKYTIRAFKSCNNLLAKLMKHKYAWVFNKPVDAKALGLRDYHDIIKHPMDLGTIKTRLSKNWYKSPREFAEDVRLTFQNAMTYNPKGQDVHVMAEELLNIFEERWVSIESDYNSRWRYQLVNDVGLPTPTSRKVHPPPPSRAPLFPELRNLERAGSMRGIIDSKIKPNASVGKTPVPKKPKAKDPNKRNMTYEEKQKLIANLQNLPSEKLDNIVEIIKKRSSQLSQNYDEIEVDIDSVDAETLWELDRFVTNYKKSLSKNKRKAELALQVRAEATAAVPAVNPTPAIAKAPTVLNTDEKNAPASSPGQGEKQKDNVSRSSSSSSSSSDSGSSSSDSDSDSSSASESDDEHSPRT
ncbi:hypothetical protein NMG60_11037000 [Bertholletia excelsa]